MIEFANLTLEAPRIAVRELRESDSRGLEWHGGSHLRSWYDEQWENHRDQKIFVMVAALRDFPIGQVAIHWHGKISHPHIPDVQSFRVFAAFRGTGIGTHLLDCCENFVANRSHERLSLSVAIENARARTLYERLGYSVISSSYEDHWEYTDACGERRLVTETILDMMKELPPRDNP